ncbi:hypothetical protein D3C80_2243000 [compost metagenome]
MKLKVFDSPKKPSSEMTHPAVNDGKYPVLLSGPNFVEESRLIIADRRYFPL